MPLLAPGGGEGLAGSLYGVRVGVDLGVPQERWLKWYAHPFVGFGGDGVEGGLHLWYNHLVESPNDGKK